MDYEKTYNMAFTRVYPMLIAKAERKGHAREDVLAVTSWLTGYSPEAIEAALFTDITYGDFFRQAPQMNINRTKVTGSVCGVKIQEIAEPLMRDIRILDKLVDELARGKAMDKILRE